VKSEEEIRGILTILESEADRYEDSYNDNFVAIQTLRDILGMKPIPDERRGRDDDY
jgi:hypothetical protein